MATPYAAGPPTSRLDASRLLLDDAAMSRSVLRYLPAFLWLCLTTGLSSLAVGYALALAYSSALGSAPSSAQIVAASTAAFGVFAVRSTGARAVVELPRIYLLALLLGYALAAGVVLRGLQA
jgi:vacuolar-type H+-ATPase subunit I/STV1